MAILFDNASSEYMEVDSAPVTAAPFTMGCWFYSDETSGSSTIMYLGNKANTTSYWRIDAALDTANDPLAMVVSESTPTTTNTSTFITQNTWMHACLSVTSATDRTIYLNGGGAVQSTTSRAPSGADRLSIARFGGSTPSQYFSGRIAEPFVYNAALSAADIALLAAGASPFFVRPNALVYYLPMIALGSTTQTDWIGGRVMTEANTPVTAAHPPNIFYPSWLTTGFGSPTLGSKLSASFRYTSSVLATPLSAMYKIFSSSVPRRTFSSDVE